MRLKEWIELLGDDQAAKTLGVKPRTIRSWREKDRMPRPKTARRIVDRTKGAVTLGEIYG